MCWRRAISATPRGASLSSSASATSALTAYLLFCVSLKMNHPLAGRTATEIVAEMRRGRPPNGYPLRVGRLDLVLIYVPLQVLAHGVLYALAGYQEDGPPTDVHAVVGDALEVVDDQGCPHPPLGGAAATI